MVLMMNAFRFLICITLGSRSISSFRIGIYRTSNALRMNADVSSIKSSRVTTRTIISAMEIVKEKGTATNFNIERKDVNAIYGLSIGVGENAAELLTSQILQKTDGPVPRSYLPSLMVIKHVDAASTVDSAAIFALIEESIQWYFDTGGRASRIEISCPDSISTVIQAMGFTLSKPSQDIDVNELRDLDAQDGGGRIVLSCDGALLKAHCEKRVLEAGANKFNLYDIIGRLAHDLGNPNDAIKPYTFALQANSKSSAAFRNMGSAYHAIGDVQLAFASYQQAIQLDETDALVYLKLAFFYEDFATKDWIDAAEHSQRCYQYYLDKVDPRDVSILTRLGNLLVKENNQAAAVDVYSKVLNIDDTLDNVWFNKANAQMHIGDLEGAAISLQRTLDLNPTVTAARHTLRSITPEESAVATSVDEEYIKDLFNDHAPVYDSHMKKLMYSATRVIRQELATVYRSKFGIFDGRYASDGSISGLIPQSLPDSIPNSDDMSEVLMIEKQIEVEGVIKVTSDKAYAAGKRMQIDKKMSDINKFKEAQKPVGAGCSSYSSFMNKTLDILDIGCGTGGAGAWLKDYARSLTGIDLSENMIAVARKKMLYQDLYVQPFNEYLQTSKKTFDLVVASDVLSYVGELKSTFQQVSKILRPGGHFVFTLEAAPDDVDLTSKGYRLLTNGRFGYSTQYIDVILSQLEIPFSTLMSRKFSPRLDVGVPVPGYLYIIQKN